jgi:hypothetical protein
MIAMVNNTNENPDELVSSLPVFQSIKCTLYNVKRFVFPQQPHSRSDLIIDERWTKTYNSRDLILADDNTNDRIIIFGTLSFFL